MEAKLRHKSSFDGNLCKNDSSQTSQKSESELKKRYAEADMRLETIFATVEQLKADMDTIDTAFAEGGLSLDEFVADFRNKQGEVDRAFAEQKALYRALCVICKKLDGFRMDSD